MRVGIDSGLAGTSVLWFLSLPKASSKVPGRNGTSVLGMKRRLVRRSKASLRHGAPDSEEPRGAAVISRCSDGLAE